MKRMSLDEFGAIVKKVMETLPEQFHSYLKYLTVDVEEEPSRKLLKQQGFTDEEIADGETILGLFCPLDPHWVTGGVDPAELSARIIIYKRSHEEAFPTRKQLMIEIRKTVIHELAHHFGYSDEELEKFDNKANPFGNA